MRMVTNEVRNTMTDMADMTRGHGSQIGND